MSAALTTRPKKSSTSNLRMEGEKILHFVEGLAKLVQAELQKKHPHFSTNTPKQPIGEYDDDTTRVPRIIPEHLSKELLIRLRTKIIRLQLECRFAEEHLDRFMKLTPREKQIIHLLAKGYNNPQIAKKLYISRLTVEQHRKHINHKLEIRSFVQLIRYAHAFDLV